MSSLRKMVEIPTSHMIPQSIMTEAIPTYQLQKGDASQSEAMSHTPLTVLVPPDYGCVTVYALCIQCHSSQISHHMNTHMDVECQSTLTVPCRIICIFRA